MSTKGHAKGHNEQLSGWSCHFQGQSMYILKRCHYIVTLSHSPMEKGILGLLQLHFQPVHTICLLKDMPKSIMTDGLDDQIIFRATHVRCPLAKRIVV